MTQPAGQLRALRAQAFLGLVHEACGALVLNETTRRLLELGGWTSEQLDEAAEDLLSEGRIVARPDALAGVAFELPAEGEGGEP